MGERVSYWLTPVAEDEGELLCTICDIAGWIAEAPTFEPHVTVYSALRAATDDVANTVRLVAREASEITLRPTRITHSDQFTKTLFIEFTESDELSRLSRALKGLSTKHDDYELKPHLSLLYANVSTEIREHFARNIPIPSRIRFDRMKAILTRGSTQTPEDVKSWRVVAEARLGPD